MNGRTIPSTLANSGPTATPPQPANKPNVGAIAGGVVGGVLVLIGVIACVFFCLRHRRREQNRQKQDLPSDPSTGSPDMAHKSPASASILQGSTLASPMPHSPAYSTQASPPAHSSPWQGEMIIPNSYHQGSPVQQYQGSPSPQHTSGDWGQQGNYIQPGNYAQDAFQYQQTYYPMPPEPSTLPAKESNAHSMSVQEMPNVRSPANAAAEMAEVRTPSPKHRTL